MERVKYSPKRQLRKHERVESYGRVSKRGEVAVKVENKDKEGIGILLCFEHRVMELKRKEWTYIDFIV